MIELTHRTRRAIDAFRESLKSTKRWSPAHQSAFNAWKRHLDDSDRHAKAAPAKTPKAAWDLAVAQAKRERDYWTNATSRALAHPGKKIGLEVFEADRD